MLHCFSFKTKGNLTKHMKSKAHYKKCVDLGITPVPTVVDDSYINEEALAHQVVLILIIENLVFQIVFSVFISLECFNIYM